MLGVWTANLGHEMEHPGDEPAAYPGIAENLSRRDRADAEPDEPGVGEMATRDSGTGEVGASGIALEPGR